MSRPLAKLCSWCGEFFSDEDRLRADRGAKLSHGICPECLAAEFPDLEDDRNEPA